MPSPFPGMDPYVDATGIWSSFHHAFLTTCADQLNERLPAAYAAVIEERIQLLSDEDLGLAKRVAEPDVTVVKEVPPQRGSNPSSSPVATLEPLTLPQSVKMLDVPKQLYLEILKLPEQNVITQVELLSPSNKRRGSEDRLAYLAKRQAVLHRYTHLVEIDLLLRGDRLPMLAPLPAGDYFAFVTRRERRHQCDVFTWRLRQALPSIPVPLHAPDPDTPLDLAAAFARVYDRGRYPQLLRYRAPHDLPLDQDDARWAADVVAMANVR